MAGGREVQLVAYLKANAQILAFQDPNVGNFGICQASVAYLKAYVPYFGILAYVKRLLFLQRLKMFGLKLKSLCRPQINLVECP